MVQFTHYGLMGGFPHQAFNLAESEVFGYTRKSTDQEGGKRKLSRSQEGQGISIQNTCAAVNLPCSANNILNEDRNHGGDEWWDGGGASGIEGDFATSTRTRPVFSDLVRKIVTGVCKAVIVWDIDRLAREVAIMQQLMTLMNRYGCVLFDRHGYVDIQTASGRNRVLQNMAAAQFQRERAA